MRCFIGCIALDAILGWKSFGYAMRAMQMHERGQVPLVADADFIAASVATNVAASRENVYPTDTTVASLETP
ncbi:hypothetical protein RB213_010324 [Colletotrichum asianum]